MTDDQIESFLQKAYMIYLHPGSYTGSTTNIPGEVSLAFKYEDADECLAFWKYARENFPIARLSINILQVAEDRIDFCLLVDGKINSLALNVRNLKVTPDRVVWFFKRQPNDKPLLLSVRINSKIQTLESTVAFMEASQVAEIHQPIIIHSWEGRPFGTSA